MQQVWWCIIFCESLKDAFQNTQSIKAKQTQPVRLNIQVEETFGKTKKQQQTNDTGDMSTMARYFSSSKTVF